MKISRCRRFGVSSTLLLALAQPAAAQTAGTVTNRGFVDAAATVFPQEAANDRTRLVGDLLLRDEVVVKPAPWVQFAAGLDARANSHDQVGGEIDFSDRSTLRPALSVRRLSATLSHRALVVDVGKQFIRWGKTDIVTPTDRFAPRDFLTVVGADFLAVTGVRAAVVIGDDTVEGVWVPRLTPSRLPLANQRWTVPPAGPVIQIVDGGAALPSGSQLGVRWTHVGPVEYSLSIFDGFNHLPTFDAALIPFATAATAPGTVVPAVVLNRTYPSIRTYGGDVAVPTRLFTIKGEAAYFTSASADEYVLYGIQLERQSGEWMFVGGYAGEAITTDRAAGGVTGVFAPDRGLSRAFVGRASYTIDSNRSAGLEAVAHQNGRGAYVKAEYSQARGDHWRATITSVLLAGQDDDFLGQYQRNSHVALALRYSF